MFKATPLNRAPFIDELMGDLVVPAAPTDKA